MKLYGTTTSPFVRRVAVLAQELGEPIERIDTAPEAGQAALRAISPIRRVPVAELAGGVVFDSVSIIDALLAAHGRGPLAPASDPRSERNALHAIDAAVDAVIQLFYLRRDGVAIDGTPYAERQLARADAVFAWLGGELVPGLGLVELATACAIDWMRFRATYPVERTVHLDPALAAWRARPAFVETAPRT